MQRRREAELAALRFTATRNTFHVKTRSLRARLRGSREAWIVGGGFVSGALVALLPLRRLAGVMRLAVSGVSFALRGPISTLFADAMANRQTSSAVPTDPDPDTSVDS